MTDEKLRLYREGFAFDSERDCVAARELLAYIADLLRENAELQERLTQCNLVMPCGHTQNFLIGDEHGHFTCTVCENAELRAQNARLREALKPFATGGVIDCLRREDYSIMRERIVDWHGPTDYFKARDAFTETRAASLEAIRAEEREACAKIANWYDKSGLIAHKIRAHGDGGEKAG